MATKRRTRRSMTKSSSGNTQWKSILIGGAVVLGLAALGYLLYLGVQEPEVIDGISRSIGISRGHDETVDYSGDELPPVGGIHSGTWQNCGIYDEPILAKNAVHSMEHGAVWIAYHPDLPEGDVDHLRDALRDESRHETRVDHFQCRSGRPELREPGRAVGDAGCAAAVCAAWREGYPTGRDRVPLEGDRQHVYASPGNTHRGEDHARPARRRGSGDGADHGDQRAAPGEHQLLRCR